MRYINRLADLALVFELEQAPTMEVLHVTSNIYDHDKDNNNDYDNSYGNDYDYDNINNYGMVMIR